MMMMMLTLMARFSFPSEVAAYDDHPTETMGYSASSEEPMTNRGVRRTVVTFDDGVRWV